MTQVDLDFIGSSHVDRQTAIKWLMDTYGPPSQESWKLKGLQYICFKQPKHATLFILRWS